MNRKVLQINCYAEGQIARVDIIGSISEWGRNNAVDMRTRCQELKDSGASKCHVYLMTVGGDCFQANEIVNILNEVFGGYTSEGGALVASAGTYISVCSAFSEQARNGQYMIHKPSGWIEGNEQDVENYLKLLKNMTATYYDAYKARLKKPEADFKAKWNAGDFWMTAQEAVEWGFLNSIKEPVRIDEDTASAIKESGSPIAVVNIDSKPNYKDEMELKAIAKSLGLPEDATQEQVNAKIADNAKKAGEYDTLKAQQEQKEKLDKASKVKAKLDEAELKKIIKADSRKKWEEAYERDFEGTDALLASLSVVPGSLSSQLVVSTQSGATLNGKTFEELQESDPDALMELHEKDPAAYEALFADWKKRKKLI
ncbi:MAG: ATP-dependent Clp protease proteolytic subunit [Bacteroidales bacterium]|nr:ATP-dependent Clp protease proteolytic subunit [Bacteroidales bacterium]MBN2748461.1 ATP-dependent Clp protease proteolytic subunit [Bacteroidales bacterium]